MKSELRHRFASQLRKYRCLLGFSQNAMANRLGVAKTTVNQWEKIDGKWQPSWEQIEEFCSWSGIKPLYFFIDEEFGSDYFELAERIRALPIELRVVIEGIIKFAEKA